MYFLIHSFVNLEVAFLACMLVVLANVAKSLIHPFFEQIVIRWWRYVNVDMVIKFIHYWVCMLIHCIFCDVYCFSN